MSNGWVSGCGSTPQSIAPAGEKASGKGHLIDFTEAKATGENDDTPCPSARQQSAEDSSNFRYNPRNEMWQAAASWNVVAGFVLPRAAQLNTLGRHPNCPVLEKAPSGGY